MSKVQQVRALYPGPTGRRRGPWKGSLDAARRWTREHVPPPRRGIEYEYRVISEGVTPSRDEPSPEEMRTVLAEVLTPEERAEFDDIGEIPGDIEVKVSLNRWQMGKEHPAP